MTIAPHPFAVGDKIRFSRTNSEFNSRFLRRFFEDADGVVTVTDAVTEPDDSINGDLTHYVRVAEDSAPVDPEVSNLAPLWNVSWFESKPVTIARTIIEPQEAPMSKHENPNNSRDLKVGDRVRVTNANTNIGGPLPHEKGTYVGETATIIGAFDSPGDLDWQIEFDNPELSSFGSWSTGALDLVEEAKVERPTVDFSDAGPSRATARAYAEIIDSRVLQASSRAALQAAARGEQVDAYALNAAITDAMRSATTRCGQSASRRELATKVAYLGHITQAVLENHADSLPVYGKGERSRLLAEVKPALAAAQQEVEAQTERANQFRTRLERSEGERSQFLQAASDERRRLCAEIDEGNAALEEATANYEALQRVAERRDALLAEMVAENDRLLQIQGYALDLLPHDMRQRVLGYADGVGQSRVERASE